MTEFKIISKPFSWNDNMGEDAEELFNDISDSLDYGACMVLGTALAKLKLLELQGAKVDERICGSCYYLECYKGKDYCRWNKKADKPARECPKEFTCKHWRDNQ